MAQCQAIKQHLSEPFRILVWNNGSIKQFKELLKTITDYDIILMQNCPSATQIFSTVDERTKWCRDHNNGGTVQTIFYINKVGYQLLHCYTKGSDGNNLYHAIIVADAFITKHGKVYQVPPQALYLPPLIGFELANITFKGSLGNYYSLQQIYSIFSFKKFNSFYAQMINGMAKKNKFDDWAIFGDFGDVNIKKIQRISYKTCLKDIQFISAGGEQFFGIYKKRNKSTLLQECAEFEEGIFENSFIMKFNKILRKK